jgi:hypothetical protein
LLPNNRVRKVVFCSGENSVAGVHCTSGENDEGERCFALVVDLLPEALRIDDDQLNAIAIELMGRIDDQPVRGLVLEAANPENSPGHRVRLLRAIHRTGAVPDADSFFDVMFTSIRDKNVAVRTAAREVIASLPGRHGESSTDR